jgi:hypothetical protein
MFKAIDLSETTDYISENDPAINKAESNIPLYQSTGDQSHLVLDGEPTIFVLGVIASREYTNIQDKHISANIADPDKTTVAPFGMSREMVMYGLKEVKNAEGFKLSTLGGNPSRVSDRSMDQLQAWGVIEELGNRLMNLNTLGDAEKKQ